jgi:prophage regulatory protein
MNAFTQMQSQLPVTHAQGQFPHQPSQQGITSAGLPPVNVNRIIRIKEVMALTGLARSTIYDRINPKSPRYDESFPKKFNLCGSNSSGGAVGWRLADILAWISQCQQGN